MSKVNKYYVKYIQKLKEMWDRCASIQLYQMNEAGFSCDQTIFGLVRFKHKIKKKTNVELL